MRLLLSSLLNVTAAGLVYLHSYSNHSTDHTGLAVVMALIVGALVVIVAGLAFLFLRNRNVKS